MDIIEYKDIIEDLKHKFKSHQIKASIRVNQRMI